jgi:hypothetical protein
MLGLPGHSRGAATATQPSANVVVIPGFSPPAYAGFHGVPALPVGASQLSAYHFSQLAANQVTLANLDQYDTAILYGIRWSDIPASGQTAINTFAATHKVLIWDSDGTGSQSYSTFIHPFSETSSGENFAGKPNDSVVTFPGGDNFLASDQPNSPFFLDPNQLVTDRDEINDMNAMTPGTANWVPALEAANAKIPNGGWPLAWTYGNIGNQTGLAIYSGIDADAFTNAKLNPNNVLKELVLQLQAPFRETPDTSCAPSCNLPPPGSGSGSTTHAACSFAKRIPTHWIHGRVVISIKTSVAAGITGRVVTSNGHTLASAKEGSGNLVRLAVQTKHLRSNHRSRLRAVIAVNGQEACTKSFQLKVDNTRPRLLKLSTSRSGSGDIVRLRVSERSSMKFSGSHVPHHRAVLIAARKTIEARLPGTVRRARLIIVDRAGNTLVRKLAW